MNDSIIFTYAGVEDSVSVYIDGKLFYSGVAFQQCANKPTKLFSMKRQADSVSYKVQIKFFRKRKGLFVCLDNIYNSMLIYNVMDYSKTIRDRRELVAVYFYFDEDFCPD